MLFRWRGAESKQPSQDSTGHLGIGGRSLLMVMESLPRRTTRGGECPDFQGITDESFCFSDSPSTKWHR